MAIVERDDPRLKFVLLDKLATPPGGLIEHLKDRYWVVDPERGAVFYRIGKRDGWAPQCNSNESVTKVIVERMHPWAEVVLVPSAFRRIDPQDYVM